MIKVMALTVLEYVYDQAMEQGTHASSVVVKQTSAYQK